MVPRALAWSTSLAWLMALLLTMLSLVGAAPLRLAGATARGGTVVVAEIDSPDTLNPYLTQSFGSVNDIDGAVFDSLYYLDPDGRYVKDLATGYAVDRSGLHWTFTIVHTALWQDGTPLTAQDIVFTTNLVTNPRFGAAFVTGFDHVKAIKAIGRYRVDVTLTSVYAPFFYLWATAPILPQHILGTYKPEALRTLTSFNQRPVGSGPLRVTQFAPDDHVTLVANERYFRGAPRLDGLVFHIVPDSNTALSQLQTGDVTLVASSWSTDREYDLLAAQLGTVSGMTVYSTRSFKLSHVSLIETGFLKDRLVRQALAYATPKHDIIDAIPRHGYGEIADGDQPWFTPWYNRRIHDSYPFNVSRARALLRQDGFAPGPDGVLRKGGQPLSLTLWSVAGEHDLELTAQILKEAWARVGVHVTVRLEDVTFLFTAPTSPLVDPARLSSPSLNAAVYWTYQSAEPDDTYY